MKAFFTDLDGTILNTEKEISPGNRAAVEEALAAGHKVIVATGRPLSSAIAQAERLGLSGEGCYVISYNGGVMWDCGAGKTIHESHIPKARVREVFAEAARRGMHIQTYMGPDVVVETRCDDEAVRRYTNLTRMTFRVLPDIGELEIEPVKMLLIDFDDHAPLVAFRDWVLETYAGELDSFFSSDCFLEIVPAGTNKGAALLKMAELLSIDPADTVAAGDEANDISMIRAAGVGACMVNGIPEAKAAADYVTAADNDHDGAAEIIRKFVLN